jgi:hypothetical protein
MTKPGATAPCSAFPPSLPLKTIDGLKQLGIEWMMNLIKGVPPFESRALSREFAGSSSMCARTQATATAP